MQDSFRKIRALTPLTPNTVELIPILGAFSPEAGPPRTRSSQGEGWGRAVSGEGWRLVVELHEESGAALDPVALRAGRRRQILASEH